MIQDQAAFRRKRWKYLVLDEAHHIKNFRSQRWQTLLNFNAKRRLLLTGTPLQNNLMELWSLLHFLMPHIFESHKEFKDWFCNPVTGMIEGTETVNQEPTRTEGAAPSSGPRLTAPHHLLPLLQVDCAKAETKEGETKCRALIVVFETVAARDKVRGLGHAPHPLSPFPPA